MAPKSPAKPSTTPEVVDDAKTSEVTEEAAAPGTKDTGAGTQPGETIGSTTAHGEAAPDGGATPEATEPAKPGPSGPGVSEGDVLSAGAGPGSGLNTDEGPDLSAVDTADEPQPFTTQTREAPYLPPKS